MGGHSLPGYGYTSFNDMQVDEIDWARWQNLVDTVAEMFAAPAAYITQANTKGVEVLISSLKGGDAFGPGITSPPMEQGLSQQVIAKQQPLYVRNAKDDPRWQQTQEYTTYNWVSYLGLPISWPDGHSFGSLCVVSTSPTDYPEVYMRVLALIRDVINSDLAHFYREAQLLTQSYTDPLTQIYNRRGFEELFVQNRQLARRLGRRMALLNFDLDGFKSINDNFGHAMGDEVLCAFARNLKQSCRSCDLVARWGGDEFLVLVHSETDAMESSMLARLDERLAALGNLPAIGYSVGMLRIGCDDSRELEELVMMADLNLYSHKQRKKKS
ncbi:sensor domain-containing diguanylate cyclase [Shewanella sedimentimangrovi]|uniref:diguanylate cyclase n=2 Tax=Shewanella sedimentimangrovi TaxID=2814293 RepID=A0ABX7R8C7_9GAMM|nr:sensor domain-containing diguanylate cyclase [Shewanella sedimentimangrovi]